MRESVRCGDEAFSLYLVQGACLRAVLFSWWFGARARLGKMGRVFRLPAHERGGGRVMTDREKGIVVATPRPVLAMCDRERELRAQMPNPSDPSPSFRDWMNAEERLLGAECGWIESGKDFLTTGAELGVKCLFVLGCIAASWHFVFIPTAREAVARARVECLDAVRHGDQIAARHEKRTTEQHEKRIIPRGER